MKKKRGLLNALIIIELLILVAVIVVGILFGQRFKEEAKGSVIEKKETLQDMKIDPVAHTLIEEEPEVVSTELTITVRDSNFSNEVIKFAGGLSLEQKIAQLIMTTPEALSELDSKEPFKKCAVGALVFSKSNYKDANQFHKLLGETNNSYKDAIDTNIWFLVRKSGKGVGTFVGEKTFDVTTLDNVVKSVDPNAKIDKDTLFALESLENVDDEYSAEALSVIVTDGTVGAKVYMDGFAGIIVGTDSDAVTQISSGCDMVFVQGDLKKNYESLIEAVNAGTISMDRINDALYRVLTLKKGLAGTGLQNITTVIS